MNILQNSQPQTLNQNQKKLSHKQCEHGVLCLCGNFMSDLLRSGSVCAHDAPFRAADEGFVPCSLQTSQLSACHHEAASRDEEHREDSPHPCGLVSDSWRTESHKA